MRLGYRKHANQIMHLLHTQNSEKFILSQSAFHTHFANHHSCPVPSGHVIKS